MNTKYLKIEITEDNIGILSINRPEALNALNTEVLHELNQVLEGYLNGENKIIGLVFTGEGEKAFIAGADIKSMIGLSNDEAKKLSNLGQQTTLLMESLPFPIIACVNGYALGGGLEMALGADFIYCSKNAVFGLPEVKLGLIPGFGGTQRLSRLVGRNLAREIIYTGKNITSDEAMILNISNKLFDDKVSMINGACETLKIIAKNSLQAISRAKKSTLEGLDNSLSEGLKLESGYFGEVFDTSDAKEGTLAFSEKRKAVFEHQK